MHLTRDRIPLVAGVVLIVNVDSGEVIVKFFLIVIGFGVCVGTRESPAGGVLAGLSCGWCCGLVE